MSRAASIEEYIPHHASHRASVETLTKEWLQEYGLLEPADEAFMAHPEAHMIAHDGEIMFVVVEGKRVGMGVIFRRDDGLYEIGKMAVTKSMRGLGLGRLIAQTLIERAKAKGVHSLYLGSNQRLVEALELYRSLGFVETDMNHNAHYESCDINMILRL